jgi:hypothetical protein
MGNDSLCVELSYTKLLCNETVIYIMHVIFILHVYWQSIAVTIAIPTFMHVN